MSRDITIYRTWDGSDMANSDSYHETLDAARRFMRETYGVKGPMQLNAEGEWTGFELREDGSEGFDIYIERLEITLTRAGLCHALKHIPHR